MEDLGRAFLFRLGVAQTVLLIIMQSFSELIIILCQRKVVRQGSGCMMSK